MTEAQAEGPGQARGALESVSASVKWGHGWSPRQRLSWHWEPLGATFSCTERAWGQHRSPHGRGEGSAVRAAVEASTPQSDMGETAPSSRLRPPGGPPQPGRSLKGPSRCLSLGEHPAASPTRTPTSDRQLWREGHLPGSGTRCILPPSACWCAGLGGWRLPPGCHGNGSKSTACLGTTLRLGAGRGAAALGGSCCHTLSSSATERPRGGRAPSPSALWVADHGHTCPLVHRASVIPPGATGPALQRGDALPGRVGEERQILQATRWSWSCLGRPSSERAVPAGARDDSGSQPPPLPGRPLRGSSVHAAGCSCSSVCLSAHLCRLSAPWALEAP